MAVYRLTFIVRCRELSGKDIDTDAYAAQLRSYGNAGDLLGGKQVHALILASDWHRRSRYLGNLLVEMYGKCGTVENARLVFDGMQKRNLFSWNLMIKAYAQNGHDREALQIYKRMRLEPDMFTYGSILSACSNLADLAEGSAIHARIASSGLECHLVVGTALIDMYGKCGSSDAARGVFDRMPERNELSWTAVLTAYAQNGHLEDARIMFDRMPQKDVVSWNAMIAAYAQKGQLEDARRLYEEMPRRDISSWNTMLVGYAQNGDLQEARSIFGEMPHKDVVSWTSMIAAYAQNGHLQEARSLFNAMPGKNLVSWNAMIAAYAQKGEGEEALELLGIMDMEGLRPNRVTFISAVDACASIAALMEGKIIHNDIINDHTLQADLKIGNALINMYSKCSCLEDAWRIFKEMPRPDVVSWNVIIGGHAHNGYGNEALELFLAMQQEGLEPNEATFVIVLSACSHRGFLSAGREWFKSVAGDFGLMPTVDLYVCMIDLLGRAGRLSEAENLINFMPFVPDAMSWVTLLAGCSMNGDVKRGEFAAQQVVQLDPGNTTVYVLLSNAHTRSKLNVVGLETNKDHQMWVRNTGFKIGMIQRRLA